MTPSNTGIYNRNCIQYFIIVIIDILLIKNINCTANQFQSIPTTVKTAENDTVLLPCYHDSPFKYIRWTRDDTELADTRYPEVISPERVRMWANGSLQVADVRAEDTGYYTCEIMTIGGIARQTHAIEVQYAPIISMFPRDLIEVRIGTILEILCDVKGTPQPIVNWRYMNDSNIALDSPRKLIIEVKNKDVAGPIECQATNGVGETVVETLVVLVLFTPEVAVKSKVVYTKHNLNAQLECIVVSAPMANVHWFHNGVPILHDFRVTRQDLLTNQNESIESRHYVAYRHHTLFVKNIRDSDLGVYECKAENKIGLKGAHIELTGKPKPPLFKPSPEMTTTTKHNLIWQTESFSPIIEYKLKFHKIPSGNITPNRRFSNIAWNELTIPADISEGPLHNIGYSLQGLEPTSVYEVVVLARNRYGWSDESNILRFATGGEVAIERQTTEILEYEEHVEDNYITDLSPGPAVFDHYNSGCGRNIYFSLLLLFNVIALHYVCIK